MNAIKVVTVDDSTSSIVRLATVIGSARFGHDGQQFFDDLIGADAFGVGVEVGEQAVPQHRLGHPLHIVDANIQSAIQDRMSFRAKHEILRGTRAGAPREPVVDERSACSVLLGRVARARLTA